MTALPTDQTIPPHRNDADVLPFPSPHDATGGSPPSACRDPRRFPYGLLVVERCMAGGANGFHWFASEAEAAHFLRSGIWDWIREDDTSSWVRSLYVEALRATSRIDDNWLLEVSTQQEEVIVVWHGAFDTLVAGGDAFAAATLADFRGRAVAEPLTCAGEIHAFIQYLQSYRG